MSVQGNIKINLQPKFDIETVFNILQNSNWSYDDHGFIHYCSEENDFDWSYHALTEIKNIISKMSIEHEKGKIVGITLINSNINSGGTFLFYPDKKTIIFSINIDRMKINSTRITDYSIYLKQLDSLFNAFECYWECSDY